MKNINRYIKIISLGLFATWFSWHIISTIIYLSPPNLIKQKLATINMNYMKYFFTQDWHLFSPVPGISSTVLWVDCGDNIWRDPIAKIQSHHYKWRVLGSGKALYVHREIPNGGYKHLYTKYSEECLNEKGIEKSCLTQKIDSDNSQVVKILKTYTVNFCSKRNIIGDLQVRIIKFWPKKYSKRNDKVKWDKFSKLEFGIKGRNHEYVNR